jgi:hypothetical protein
MEFDVAASKSGSDRPSAIRNSETIDHLHFALVTRVLTTWRD